MIEAKESKTARSEHPAILGWSTLAAAGAVMCVAGGHANGSVIYNSIGTTIDSNGTSSTTINLPVGASNYSGLPLFTFTASNTNGLTAIKPSVGSGVENNTATVQSDMAIVLGSSTNVGSGNTISLTTLAYAFAPGSLISKYTINGVSGFYSNSGATGTIGLAGQDNTINYLGHSDIVTDTLISANGATGQFNGSSPVQYIGFDASSSSSNVYDGYVAIQLLADSPTDVSADILGVGIETTPNIGIDAGSFVSVPEPTSLGLLAMGSVGLLAYRGRRRTA